MDLNEISSLKRQRGSSEETSPSSVQNQKQLKVIPQEDLIMEKMQNDIAQILANQTVMIRDIADIKKTMENIEGRVSTLEDDVKVLKDVASNQEAVEGEMNDLWLQNESLKQEMMSNQLVIRNLPLKVIDEKEEATQCAKKIMAAIGMAVTESNYEAFAFKTSKAKTASIQITFETSMLKARALKKYRELKKADEENPFTVEKFVNILPDDPFNGKLITMSNRLTPHTMSILLEARKFIPNDFIFVYDTADCHVIAKGKDGKSYKIRSESDIQEAIKQIGNKKKRGNRQRPHKSSIRTRSRARVEEMDTQ